MILPQNVEMPGDLRSLTREQLLVLDHIINERSRTVREHSRLTTTMRKSALAGNVESFRLAERQAKELSDLVRAYALAVSAALDAFRIMNKRPVIAPLGGSATPS
jgi:hypothetical protein